MWNEGRCCRLFEQLSKVSSSLIGTSRDIDTGDLTEEPLAALGVYKSIAIVTLVQLRLVM